MSSQSVQIAFFDPCQWSIIVMFLSVLSENRTQGNKCLYASLLY